MFGRVHLCSEKGRKVMPAYEVGLVDKIIVWRGRKQHQNVRQIITEKKLHLNRRRLCGSRLFCENLTCLNLLKIAKNSSNKFFRLIDCLGTEIWRTYLKFSVKWRRHITTFNFKKESIHKTSDNRLFSAAGPAFLSLEIKIFHHKNVSLKRLDSVPLSPKAVVSLLRR